MADHSGERVEYDPLPPHIRIAVGAVLHGMVPDGRGGGDGLNKDDALAYAGELAQWVATEQFDMYGGRLLAERNRYYHALHRIAAEDYRGNRPESARIAQEALEGPDFGSTAGGDDG